MTQVPRQKLRELLAIYGRSVCDDPRRCEALLRDYCGGHKREIHLLISALRERVAADLLVSQNGTPYEVQSARLIKRLRDNLGLADDAAKWAVDSWAFALGITTNAQQHSAAVNQKSSGERTREPAKRKMTATNQQSSSSVQKPTVNAEKKSQFAGAHVTDRRASSGLPAESKIDSHTSPPISDVTHSSPAARSAPSRTARLVFVGLLILAGILIIAGVIVAIPEMMRGDDPDETTLYVWIPAIFLLSLSLVGLLPNVRFRIFLFISTAFFLSGVVAVVASEYILKTHAGAPYWADIATVTGPFSIAGVLVGFGISKLIMRSGRGADVRR